MRKTTIGDQGRKRREKTLNGHQESPPPEHEDRFLSSAGGGPGWGDEDGDWS